jgi:hypothetical protein
MKLVASFFLAAALLIPLSVAAQNDYRIQSSAWMFQGHEEWLKCQTDDQCTIIFTPGCGFRLAVNKTYLDQAGEFASKRDDCNSLPHYPEHTASQCLNNQCVLVPQQRK